MIETCNLEHHHIFGPYEEVKELITVFDIKCKITISLHDDRHEGNIYVHYDVAKYDEIMRLCDIYHESYENSGII